MVYLLTKDGVVEYVDVLHCLMFGSALVCQDPIYIANNGVALERSGREVNLRREDGSVLELAPLTAEWNAQEIPSEAVGAFNDMSDNQFDWMDVESNGSVQMGVQDNNVSIRATPTIWAWCRRAWCWASLPARRQTGCRASPLWRR